ncbi:DUF3054 domain-containing protein [Cryobacterium sp. TMT2-18-3]|uniref:DUF3054 domain-containing protein n=1 Tax=unclassified Cryobacterium TaxID=2649013 RepID=UPI00106C6C18|nr:MULTISPECIES: DUF3054 domain-containing protein [unclassified Cryobacterium]TFC26315.1 DUF3054 domain-containing protein [Cryobacterium sp. TMT2-18-2]TFC35365.1 DUF3054 domain-containing protein [Cryobacterium sp. TMT2-42-4]TFC60479.1 DUF3054 domain-containing protein [Cryobacterium sp. TMT2-15-1]TFC64506.1 DUF3054 domain-containing protein [Cryobacterium sp. TMT2-18-3]
MAIQQNSRSGLLLAAGLDAALVLVFVLIGRASHQEEILGTLITGLPFLGGLLVGWLIMRAWRSPQKIVWTGTGIWLFAVGVGMLLRTVSGQGTEFSFVVVATVVLGVFLLGWRGLAVFLRHRQARTRAVA